MRPNDTSPEAQRVLNEVYRRMTPGQKWLRLGQVYREARLLHAAGVGLRKPSATPQDVVEDWMRLQFGLGLSAREGAMTVDPDSLRGLRAVTEVLTRLDVPYALGGSMAAAIYARGRQTNDADVTVEPFPGKEAQLIAALGPDYYVSPESVAQANRARTSFNIINTLTGFKVDVFVRPDSAFEQSAWGRRRAVPLPDRPGEPLVVLSPEDLLLFKLRWYRLGNESSELQWRDVKELLQIQAGQLDNTYLDHWAGLLGVADLLARARQESAV
ncbi:MAG TPA: hypothetical protein VKA46_01915 [Gemmataceae bacterium]|nr:hypothetical protein [Gemmataceae bacterium]